MNEAENKTTAPESAIPNEQLVMLPPYVAPEHRSLIDLAEKCLADYEQSLLARIKTDFDQSYGSISPGPVHIRAMEREFYDDPMRRCLINRMIEIKTICEKPRMMIVKAT